jgi:predicted phosphodiesterase
VHPRVILLGAVVAVLVAIALYAAAPWILPVRIYEGPLVQMSTTDGVTVVWYTTRPAECTVFVNGAGQQRNAVAETDGRRNRVRVAGLLPGTTYAYEIRVGKRALTSDLVFHTVRASGERFTFVVFGDSGLGTRAQYLLAAEMAAAQPPADLLVHVGDLVYGRGDRRLYEERFFAPYRHLLAQVNFWPCVGNHDVDETGNAAAYQEVFEVPANGPPGLAEKQNYWFDYAAGRFAVIDSNVDEATLRDQVAPWLTGVMAASGARWRFVVFHHPPYTGGRYAPDERIQRALVPAIEAAGVDVVFNGHDHNYQRSYPLLGGHPVEPGNGVVYVVTGAGGAELYPARQPRPEFVAALDDQHHSFTQVVVDGDTLRLRQIASGGAVFDEFVWQKPAPREEVEGQPDATATAPAATSGP